jgi:hypothetical protein
MYSRDGPISINFNSNQRASSGLSGKKHENPLKTNAFFIPAGPGARAASRPYV